MRSDGEDQSKKLTPEEMLRQVWNNYFPHRPWEEAFIIDTGLSRAVARSLLPFPEEMAATLDWWRDKMIAVVDATTAHCKNEPTLAGSTIKELREELARRAAGRKNNET
jgi:hypothetical protein